MPQVVEHIDAGLLADCSVDSASSATMCVCVGGVDSGSAASTCVGVESAAVGGDNHIDAALLVDGSVDSGSAAAMIVCGCRWRWQWCQWKAVESAAVCGTR